MIVLGLPILFPMNTDVEDEDEIKIELETNSRNTTFYIPNDMVVRVTQVEANKTILAVGEEIYFINSNYETTNLCVRAAVENALRKN